MVNGKDSTLHILCGDVGTAFDICLLPSPYGADWRAFPSSSEQKVGRENPGFWTLYLQARCLGV